MIKLALFDMDGTIVESQLDWQSIRNHLNIKPGKTILKDIYNDGDVDEERLTLLENYERENTLIVAPIVGVAEFLAYLESVNIQRALITNNNRRNTDYLVKNISFPLT